MLLLLIAKCIGVNKNQTPLTFIASLWQNKKEQKLHETMNEFKFAYSPF